MKRPLNRVAGIFLALALIAFVFGLNGPVPGVLWVWVVIGLAAGLIAYPLEVRQQGSPRRRFIWAMLAYALLVMVAVYTVRRGLLPGWELPLSLLPLLPGILVVFTVVAALRAMDELEQRIQLEAFAFGFGILFLALLSESLLGIAGLESGDPGVYLLYMAAAWMMGQLLARRRYR